jgi:hypothetical protein
MRKPVLILALGIALMSVGEVCFQLAVHHHQKLLSLHGVKAEDDFFGQETDPNAPFTPEEQKEWDAYVAFHKPVKSLYLGGFACIAFGVVTGSAQLLLRRNTPTQPQPKEPPCDSAAQ